MTPRIRADVAFAIIPEWILHSSISDRAVRLYGILWRHTDKAGRARPSRARQAKLLGDCSLDSVDRAKGELVGIGALSVEKRFTSGGDQTANDYVLHVTPFGAEQTSFGDGGGAAEVRPGGREGAATPGRVGAAQNERKDLELEKTFVAFWEAYPPRNGKKLSRGKAEEVWKKLSGDERARAMTGVAHYGHACRSGVTLSKDAFRWLRDRAFDDWQTPAEGVPEPVRSLEEQAQAHGAKLARWNWDKESARADLELRFGSGGAHLVDRGMAGYVDAKEGVA